MTAAVAAAAVAAAAVAMTTTTIKEKSVSHTRKTLARFTTADSYAWNITHNVESTAV
jgi:hypothetical protein